MRTSALLLGLLLASTALADTTVYRSTRPDGIVEFGDSPQNGAEQLRVPEIQTFTAPKVGSSPSSAPQDTRDQSVPAPVQYRVAIVSPVAGETIPRPEAGLDVAVAVTPGVGSGFKVQLQLDGRTIATGMAGSYKINEIDRGEHTLTASLLAPDGNTVTRSKPITFYIQQYSSLFRRR